MLTPQILKLIVFETNRSNMR